MAGHKPEDLIQPLMEALIKVGMARGLREAATQILHALGTEPGDPSGISKVDCTDIECHDHGEYELVVVKTCPFEEIKAVMGQWSEKSNQITEGYNVRPSSGGGAFDPICVIHRLTRQFSDPDNVVQLGCASPTDVILSEKECARAEMDQDKARALLKGNACLYARRKK